MSMWIFVGRTKNTVNTEEIWKIDMALPAAKGEEPEHLKVEFKVGMVETVPDEFDVYLEHHRNIGIHKVFGFAESTVELKEEAEPEPKGILRIGRPKKTKKSKKIKK